MWAMNLVPTYLVTAEFINTPTVDRHHEDEKTFDLVSHCPRAISQKRAEVNVPEELPKPRDWERIEDGLAV